MELDNKILTLAERVKLAKQTLKESGVKRAKIKFFDLFYGAMLKSDNIRLDNFWAGYTTQEFFTINLEKYVEKCKNETI